MPAGHHQPRHGGSPQRDSPVRERPLAPFRLRILRAGRGVARRTVPAPEQHGGAPRAHKLGNVVDRIIHGAVFDFIYFHAGKWGFPAFNLADAFIFLGVVVVLYAHNKEAKEIAKAKEEEYAALQKATANAALETMIDDEVERIMKLGDARVKKEAEQTK